MRAFIDGCRTIAAAVTTIAVFVLATLTVGSAPVRADSTFEFKGSGAPSTASRQVSRSKKMRLGATTPQRRKRESLAGGVPSSVERRAIRSVRVHRQTQRRAARTRTASLGTSFEPTPSFGQNLAGRGIQWNANSGCLNASLRAVIAQVAGAFGPVRVSSTCRSRRHNSRVGGAHRSHHLSGNAVDFRVLGASARAVYSFLRNHASVGGLKLYRRGFFHIDTGARRSW